jgi:hypothetical protein
MKASTAKKNCINNKVGKTIKEEIVITKHAK